LPVKVSVVVPVYNPGRNIDVLLDSLGRQSLPASDFEVIFVDDGSTDGTGERLDRLATENPNFRVMHIPNSGWPSRPRNLGIEAACGEYVHFVDNDDILGDEALERLYDYAVANGSDVVLGREVRRGLRRPASRVFRENRPYATLADAPLLALLTPHKMFRRQFLIDNGLRFTEGPTRFEDHPFVVAAYFAAKVISVLADYTCYYWVAHPDVSNAGRQPKHLTHYFRDLREPLDVVERNTEPGEFRDSLLVQWYLGKGLSRLGGGLSRRDDDDADLLFRELRQLADERFPVTVDRHLVGVMRVRSALLRAGRFDDLRELGRTEVGLTSRTQVLDIRPIDGGFNVTVSCELVYADGTPVSFESRDGRSFWRPPVALAPPLDPDLLDFTEALADTNVVVSMWDKLSGDTFPLPVVRATRSPADRGAVEVTVRIDSRSAAFGEPRRGRWQLIAQLRCCGWTVLTPLRGEESLPSVVAASSDRLDCISGSPGGLLRLWVDVKRVRLLRLVQPTLRGSRLVRTRRAVDLRVPLPQLRLAGDPVPVRLRLQPRNGGRPIGRDGYLGGRGGDAAAELRIRVPLSGPDAVRRGRYGMRLAVPGHVQPLGVVLSVGPDRVSLLGRAGAILEQAPMPGRVRRKARGAARRLVRTFSR
jgi:poly(ribitol-phosphate) beta-N-acetylglucosaminyltransferase